jgi:hypothetical protein
MSEVDQEKLNQSLDEAFAPGKLPFCHDKKYKLRYGDRALCSLSKAELQRCPAFRDQCGAPAPPPPERKREASTTADSGSHVSTPGWVSGLAELLFWALVVGVVVALAVSIFRMQKSRPSGEEDDAEERDPEPAPDPGSAAAVQVGDKDVERLLERARRAAERGELGAAIDAAHAAAIQGLSAAGHVEVERDRTNGDYLRELRKAPPIQQQFRAIVGHVEVAQFGGKAPTRGTFDQVLDQVMALLRRLSVLTLVVLVAASLAGCRGGGRGARNETEEETPSGLATFKRLLAGQGGKVHTRMAPLSKLGDDVGMVVVLSTTLEQEDEQHLLNWVREGGSAVVVDSAALMDAAEVEGVYHSCGTSAERGPNLELAPLNLSVIGGESLKLRPKPDSLVAQRVDVICGGSPYIVTSYLGAGQVTFIPEDELLSNASLSVNDNARLVTELFSAPDESIELVGSWTGDGSQSPMQSMKSAGLMPVVWQLFAVALLLALRQGTSFGSRRDDQKLERRAFADHVRAVASNYARAGAGRLVSGHYGLLLVDQLRERLCPGQTPTLLQLASVIARRVSRPESEIVQLLVEAKTAFDDPTEGPGVNHKLIRELEQLSLQAGGIS